MIATQDFVVTLREVLNDTQSRKEFLREAGSDVLAGRLGDARALLRQFVVATCGFSKVAAGVSLSQESLVTILEGQTEPAAQILCDVLSYLLQQENASLKVVISEEALVEAA